MKRILHHDLDSNQIILGSQYKTRFYVLSKLSWPSNLRIYKWLFQLDDSKSLYKKWLFHQTSIYKWLFGVPGKPECFFFELFCFGGPLSFQILKVRTTHVTGHVFNRFSPRIDFPGLGFSPGKPGLTKPKPPVFWGPGKKTTKTARGYFPLIESWLFQKKGSLWIMVYESNNPHTTE